MRTATLADVSAALADSWSAETADPADRAAWTPQNPSRGQCGASALVVHDLLGGDLVVAEVLEPDGSAQGYHYWNLLPDGCEVDLTRAQFDAGEQVQPGRVVPRPDGPPRRCAEEYELLRRRVLLRLSARAPA